MTRQAIAPVGTVSQNSLGSAAVVVPLVLEHVIPASVIDFGCKHGEWLSVFQKQGVSNVVGLDRHERMHLLLIDPARYRRVDLRQPLEIEQSFDLALCLEVAEHLPSAAAEPLVSALTEVAPVVLFSAAVPLQGGNEHLNERPRRYWQQLFERRSFRRLDCIRPLIWQDARVAWWYRQNTFLFVSEAAFAKHPRLREVASRAAADDLDLIHTDLLHERSTARGWLRYSTLRGRCALQRLLGASLGRTRA